MNRQYIARKGFIVVAAVLLLFSWYLKYMVKYGTVPATVPVETVASTTINTDQPLVATTSPTQPTPVITPQPTPTPPPPKPIGSSPQHSPFGSPFTLAIGSRMVLSDGLRVTLTSIGDSRCKAGVECIWAGELAPILTVVPPEDSFTGTTKTVSLGTVRTPTADIGKYHIVLGDATTGSATLTITETGISTASVVGTISGTVTFTNVCPVEQSGVPCETPREMFSNRNAVAYLTDGVTMVGRVMLNPNGTYSIQLPPNSYVVQIQPAGIGAGEKKPVTVSALETSVVNFTIDTGIR